MREKAVQQVGKANVLWCGYAWFWFLEAVLPEAVEFQGIF
jgi:hypothetical protein